MLTIDQAQEQRDRFAFVPCPGPQTEAYCRWDVDEMLYGGARGGGKTRLALGKFLPLAMQWGKAATGVVFRRSYPDLEQVIKEGQETYCDTGLADWLSQPKAFRFHNGAELKCRYIERLDDARKYQGHEYVYQAWDECQDMPSPEIFARLRACLRSPVKGIPKQVVYTANPGGALHNWIVERFGISLHPDGGKIIQDKDGRRRLYIKSLVSDNTYLAGTDYEDELRAIEDPVLRAAWLEGRWDIVVGSFFGDLWRRDKHVFENREGSPPQHWPIFRSMDWGSAHPFCVLWWTVAVNDVQWNGRYWPQHAIIVFREWYGSPKIGKNVGLGLPPDGVARGILERERRWAITRARPGPADTSMWNDDGTPSIATIMAEAGVKFIKAYKDRYTGNQQVRARLKGTNADDGPLLYFTTDCPACITTMPVLVRDEHDIEDVDSEQDDHAYDTIKYLANSFKLKLKTLAELRKPKPKDDEDLVLDDIAGM
jgi:hypothetical protein